MSGSILRDGYNKKYSVNLETSLAPEYIEAFEREKRLNKLGEELLQIVSNNPNRYNAQELEVLLKDNIEFTNQEFTSLITHMQSIRAIKVGADGKISRYFEKPE